jgi:uncharacterized protein YaaN involved in tellurite resistance
MGYLTKRNMDMVSLDGLSDAKKNEIIQIKNGLSLSYENVVDFGSSASKNLSSFSTELLTTMKVKDSPEVETMLTELMTGLQEVDCDNLLKKKPSLLKKILRIDDLQNFMIKYEDVQTVINTVKKKLEQTQFQLKKDIELCERYLEQNMNYIEELDSYIMAGMLKVQEEREQLALEEQTLDKSDQLAVHEFSARQNDVERLDRKVHDLTLMREIAIQNIPQIQLIKGGDAVLIEKIQSSINSAIPLWESQIVIAIELMRQKSALTVQKNIVDTTNKLITKNSELLKVGAVEVARELERGIVDIETLKKSQENLIQTLDSIKTIRQDGRQQRLQVAEELTQIHGRLNDALLLTE